ncbi:hypothetical protein ABZP36_024806 [Zizania latifolia]
MITAIFKAVPMLATLEMVYCTGFVGSCRVESSAVRNLLFMSALEQREITLKLAGLTTVTLRTRSKVKMVKIQPAPKIRRAYLHIARPRTKLKSRIRPFLDAGTGLTCLTLRGVAVMLLSSEYKQTPKLAVTFEDLWILSLSLDFSNESQLCFLLKLLESCPNLQKLSLSTVCSYLPLHLHIGDVEIVNNSVEQDAMLCSVNGGEIFGLWNHHRSPVGIVRWDLELLL